MNSQKVLDIFKEITTIPRESGHEEAMTRWLLDWAAARGLGFKSDSTGNVLITREAAPGKEDVPAIVLQAHQDMVCEKNSGSAHDFAKDPIPYVVEDGWMVSHDTTLGADDGIGIAACLALLEDSAPTGKVECLFTISEETGMDGAEALQGGFFTGGTLINLDSEDEGQLFIGCAGGLNTRIRFSYRRDDLDPSWKAVRLRISGCIGGHSGDDIDKGRVNAVQQMARFLYKEWGEGMQLVSLEGGGKPNAIARECEAVVVVPSARATKQRFHAFGKVLAAEFHATDPGVTCKAENAPVPRSKAIDDLTACCLVNSLFTCPHGVQAMSQDVPGLVQTSTNLASVHIYRNFIEIVTSQRSPAASERRMIAAKVAANFDIAGGRAKHMYEYPGWEPDVNSHILKVCVESYRRLFAQEPEVKAIHAGLECGLFLTKFPGLDMISFGPTLRGVHAPGERLELASLDKFVKLLEDVVCNFR